MGFRVSGLRVLGFRLYRVGGLRFGVLRFRGPFRGLEFRDLELWGLGLKASAFFEGFQAQGNKRTHTKIRV